MHEKKTQHICIPREDIDFFPDSVSTIEFSEKQATTPNPGLGGGLRGGGLQGLLVVGLGGMYTFVLSIEVPSQEYVIHILGHPLHLTRGLKGKLPGESLQEGFPSHLALTCIWMNELL